MQRVRVCVCVIVYVCVFVFVCLCVCVCVCVWRQRGVPGGQQLLNSRPASDCKAVCLLVLRFRIEITHIPPNAGKHTPHACHRTHTYTHAHAAQMGMSWTHANTTHDHTQETNVGERRGRIYQQGFLRGPRWSRRTLRAGLNIAALPTGVNRTQNHEEPLQLASVHFKKSCEGFSNTSPREIFFLCQFFYPIYWHTFWVL